MDIDSYSLAVDSKIVQILSHQFRSYDIFLLEGYLKMLNDCGHILKLFQFWNRVGNRLFYLGFGAVYFQKCLSSSSFPMLFGWRGNLTELKYTYNIQNREIHKEYLKIWNKKKTQSTTWFSRCKIFNDSMMLAVDLIYLFIIAAFRYS